MIKKSLYIQRLDDTGIEISTTDETKIGVWKINHQYNTQLI